MEALFQEIYDLFTGPVQRQMSRSEYINNLRAFLGLLAPALIYNKMVEGANAYLSSRFQETISSETYEKIRQCLVNLQEVSTQLNSLWDALDHYEKYEIWNGIDENEISGDAVVGALIGSLIAPGVGTVIGSWLGQASSYARIEEKVENASEMYIKGITHFVVLYEECLNEVILPAILEDFQRIAEQIEAEESQPAIETPVETRESYLDELERLGQLRREGHINWWEYRRKKREILARA